MDRQPLAITTPSAALLVALVAACSSPAAPPAVLPGPKAPRLAAPRPIDPDARGAAYLTSVAVQLQPGWGQFLDDCRLRLPANHPLNAPALAATVDLAVDRTGAITDLHLAGSGNADFDRAVRDAIADATPFSHPPADLLSDDDELHLRWLFARDRRQAGPSTAEVVTLELPLLHVVERLVEHRELVRAAHRITRAPDDHDRGAATERVMIGALREAFAANGPARRAAAVAIGRARITELAPELRSLLTETTDTEQRLVAIAAVAELGDREAVPALSRQLVADLADRRRLALAETAALIALGAHDDVARTLRGILDADGRAPHVIALEALALVPAPALPAQLATWFERGDARTRAAVCAAVANASPTDAARVIARGLRDPDATVRATCVDAARRQPRLDPAIIRRLHDLARDRDRSVRAQVVAAIAVADPAHPLQIADDDAPEVRAAFAASAPSGSDAALRVLADDRDPDVRAAAIVALGDRAPELTARAASDPAPQVRRAAIATLADGKLELLAGDDSPEVATAALIRTVAHQGRGLAATPLLQRLAAAPAGGAERVRIALAWLLAR